VLFAPSGLAEKFIQLENFRSDFYRWRVHLTDLHKLGYAALLLAPALGPRVEPAGNLTGIKAVMPPAG
jgi:hypothetical protein